MTQETILAFGFREWFPQPRYTMDDLLEGLGKHYRFVFVEGPRSWSQVPASERLPRLWGGTRVHQEDPYLVLDPPLLLPHMLRLLPQPLRTSWTIAWARLSMAWMAHTLRPHLLRYAVDPTILWFSLPYHCSLIGRFGERMRCYYVPDEWDRMPGWEPLSGAIERWEQVLVPQCDVVICPSQARYDRRYPLNPEGTLLIPNVVDVARFSPPAEFRLPADLESIPPPRLGIMGQVDFRIDFDLIEELAQARPNWSFVFFGEIRDSGQSAVARLERLPNIHFLGHREPNNLRYYLAAMAVCLIPFGETILRDTIHPQRLYPYLAAGKPVVSVPLPDLHSYQPLVRIAQSPAEFRQAIEEEMATDNPQKQRARQGAAEANSSERWVAELVRLFEQRLAASSAGETIAPFRGPQQ